MKIIRPLGVNDAVLLSSNVPETDYPAHVMGTTYGLGDRVIVTSPSSSVTLTIAAPCVVTWTGHGLPAGTPVMFTTTGALPTGLTAGKAYYVIAPQINSFNVSATLNGPVVNTSGTQSGTHTCQATIHKCFESLQAANTGHNPLTSPTWWVEVSATNRWKMFDGSMTSQTTNHDTIVVSYQIQGRADSVAVMNVSAASVRVVMTDAVDGVVFDQTVSMVTGGGINDWWQYYFEPPVRLTDTVISGMPPYANATLTITISDVGSTPACGLCVIGQIKTVGATQYGASVGIQDYSTKQKDTYGVYTVLEKEFNKRGTFSIEIPSAMVDPLEVLLAQYRAKPMVYIGAADYSSTMLYGYYKDFSIAIAYFDTSICNIEIEGLT